MSIQRFLLPRTDGSWLTDPSPEQWPNLLTGNHTSLSRCNFDCQGRTLTELRRLTQQHVRQAALRYTAELLGHEIAVPDHPTWIVTGHQPELFHTGVWVKNYAVSKLAATTISVGLNLIVDNDTHPAMGIKVPVGTQAKPHFEFEPFDVDRPVAPWEEAALIDRDLFRSFPKRVAQSLRPWGIEPTITEFWPAAVAYADRTPSARLCDCLAAARAAAEHRWGAGNLELPISKLDILPGFLWFAANILAHLPRFLELHNTIIQDYRRQHRLRSRTHPVPDLALDNEWHEAPFWVWRAGDTHRGRLFAKLIGSEVWLRDRNDVFAKLSLSKNRSACCAVEQLADLPARGIRLRSRALTTTLFARLFLADLFVHGIGGAKYDEMADALIAKYYQLPVPAYATISATLHLPLGGDARNYRQLLGENSQALWQWEHHPEQFLSEAGEAENLLIHEKQRLISEQHSAEKISVHRRSILERDANRQRYHRLQEINRELQSHAKTSHEQIVSQKTELLAQLSAQRILTSREFSWVLFPADRLQGFLQNLPIL